MDEMRLDVYTILKQRKKLLDKCMADFYAERISWDACQHIYMGIMRRAVDLIDSL